MSRGLNPNYVYKGNFEEYVGKEVFVAYKSKEHPHDVVEFQGEVVDTYNNGVQGNQGIIIEDNEGVFKHIKANRIVEKPQIFKPIM